MVLKCNEENKGQRLDQFLENELEESRSQIKKYIMQGNIKINGSDKTKAGHKLKGNEEIIIEIPDEEIKMEAEDIDIDIVYEDEDIAVINKKAGIVVHPAAGHPNGTLVNAILYHLDSVSKLGEDGKRPGIVHRLDKDTSGLIIVAKNNKTYYNLVEMFKNRGIDKTYLAIVKGRFNEKEGRIENLIGRNPRDRKQMAVVTENGKLAISNYKVLEENSKHSLMEVNIETGRTHQIRVHMKDLNHPLLGDETYGKKSKLVDRQMLHAYRLIFNHPITGEKMEVIGELPEDFKMTMKKEFKIEKVELK